jgi:hypothetical protein
VKQIAQTIESQDPSFSKLPKAHQELVWSLTNSVVCLLSILAEAQDEIVEAISKLPNLINFLFGLLSFDFTPSELEIEVLSCLIALSEDNKPLAQQIVDNEYQLKALFQAKDSAEVKAVSACGVLHNLFAAMQWYDHNTPIEDGSDAMLIPVLVQFMDVPKSNGTNGHSHRSSPDQILRLAVEVTASIATCLQEALEHGARHEAEFQGFDDDGAERKHEIKDEDDGIMELEGEDDEIDGDEQSMDSEGIDADMDIFIGDGPDEEINPAEELTLDRLVRIAAPKLLRLALTEDPIQLYALSALNNIAWTVSSIDFSTGHLESLQKYWSSFSRRIWKECISPVLASNTSDIDLASSVTSLAWAVARSVQGDIGPQSDEHRKFMAIYEASKTLKTSEQEDGSKKGSEDRDDAFQGLGVKAIGVLGRLALNPAPIELNREIGVFLITVLAGLPDNTPAADAVESMNQIFDIYADKSFAFDEAVFWADGFYKHLEEILPKARKMAKGIDKRKFGELRARADEAVLNLGRFLKYKRTERNGGG